MIKKSAIEELQTNYYYVSEVQNNSYALFVANTNKRAILKSLRIFILFLRGIVWLIIYVSIHILVYINLLFFTLLAVPYKKIEKNTLLKNLINVTLNSSK